MEKFEGGKLLERAMDGRNNNVKVYLKEVELESTYWIHLAQVLMNTEIKFVFAE